MKKSHFYLNAGLVISMLLFMILTPAIAQPEVFKIGTATKIINHEIGNWVQGATKPVRATEIRGDLEANAIYFSKGTFQLLMISCDLGGLESAYVMPLKEAIGVAAGISSRDILISCTHARGPSLIKSNYLMPLDTIYMELLQQWLIDLAKEVVNNARPAKIGYAKGEAQIGFSRRLTWADGTHSMFGDAKRKDFNGLEGPNDPQHSALFAKDMNGKLITILYNNTSHIPIYYGAGIYSSELPGEVRKSIRNIIGDNIPILFLNGAQGDISLNDQLNPRKETNEEWMARKCKILVDETMALYKEVTFDDDPVLKHAYKDLLLAVRLPETEQLIKGRAILARIDTGEYIRGMKMVMAFGVVQLHEVYGKAPFDILPIHAIRIGDLAIVTEPCEMYCQFGLDIKQRSPVSNTMVVGLTNGRKGYVPTIYGVLGGGYTGTPTSGCRLEPYAGYKIVECASLLLHELWRTD